jgi:glycosyltransferase involved in cell wall biosynthesis
MKIAFVFPPMWTPHSDGSLQIWNHEVTTRLSKSCDVFVYSGVFSSQPDEYVDGVRYRRFSTRLDDLFLKRFRFIRNILGIQGPLFRSDLWYAGYYLKVALDLHKQGCDAVHVHYYPQFAALIKCLNPTLRVILHMHGEWLTQVKYTNLNSRLRKIDLVISCSEFVTRATCTMFPQIASHCRTVPMGVSPDAFSRRYQNSHTDNSSPRRLLFVGRISPEKGVHILLDAFESIIRQYPDATLTIVGPEWIAPREDITDLCLERDVVASLAPFYRNSYLLQLKQMLSPEAAKRVAFAGLVAHSDIPTWFGRADIYISPSLYESFGVTLIEAMAAGLPVVSTRVGAAPELISDGHSGLLVETNNASSIHDAVINLFRDDRLRNSMSHAAHETVCKQFSWETICSALTQMYRGVPDTNGFVSILRNP